jgi:hypothetical protein
MYKVKVYKLYWSSAKTMLGIRASLGSWEEFYCFEHDGGST